MDDFNINLLKYNTHSASSDFLYAMYDNFFSALHKCPSQVTLHSKSPIDSIFSNMIEDGSNSGNLAIAISDHYGRFVMKTLSNKKTLQIQKYIIRTSKRSMRRD